LEHARTWKNWGKVKKSEKAPLFLNLNTPDNVKRPGVTNYY